jgi:hypothetical protein
MALETTKPRRSVQERTLQQKAHCIYATEIGHFNFAQLGIYYFLLAELNFDWLSHIG